MTLFLVLFCAVLYAIFGFFVARSSMKLDAFFANALFNAPAVFGPLLVFLAATRKNEGAVTRGGVIDAVIAGVVLTVFSVLLVKIYARGGNLAYVMPVVYGGTVVIGSFLGWWLLKEAISPLQFAGIALVTVGIGCIIASKL